MSASLAKRIRDHSRSTGTARAALFTIATYCNEQRGDQTAWPGEEALATSLHIKQRAVRDLFRELEALEELTIRRRARKTALLTIHLPDERKPAAGHMTGTPLPLIKHDRQSSVSMTGSARARNGDNKKRTRTAAASLNDLEGVKALGGDRVDATVDLIEATLKGSRRSGLSREGLRGLVRRIPDGDFEQAARQYAERGEHTSVRAFEAFVKQLPRVKPPERSVNVDERIHLNEGLKDGERCGHDDCSICDVRS